MSDEINVTTAEEAVAETVETAVETAAEAVEDAAQTVKEAAETVAETVEETAEAAAETAEEAAEAATEAAEEVAETAKEAVEAAEETVSETVKEAAPAESMDDYAQELEATYRRYYPGDVITGTVIGVSETEITMDFGYYTDGIIRLEDASDDPSFSLKNNVQVGQTISATVIRTDDGSGHMLLSMKEAADKMAWDRLRELKETQGDVSVKVSAVTKSGVIAYLEGIRGFIPASKLALGYVEEADLESYVGKTIDVRVITAEQEGKKLVLSAKEILREKEAEERSNRINSVEVGMVTEGKVETIKPYGAFINLGKGLSGLLHVSQISHTRIKTPDAVLKEGQTVKVKVIANKDGKLSLSMKVLEENAPAEAIDEEPVVIPKSENISTSLGDLLSKLNLKF